MLNMSSWDPLFPRGKGWRVAGGWGSCLHALLEICLASPLPGLTPWSSPPTFPLQGLSVLSTLRSLCGPQVFVSCPGLICTQAWPMSPFSKPAATMCWHQVTGDEGQRTPQVRAKCGPCCKAGSVSASLAWSSSLRKFGEVVPRGPPFF